MRLQNVDDNDDNNYDDGYVSIDELKVEPLDGDGEPILLNSDNMKIKVDMGEKEPKKIIFKTIMIVAIAICSVIFICAAVKSVKAESFMKKAKVTEGIVTSADSYTSGIGRKVYYKNYVTYEVDGVTYKDVFWGESDSSMGRSRVTVYYDPNQPEKISDGHIFSLRTRKVLIGIGIILAGLVYCFIAAERRRRFYSGLFRLFNKP